MPFSAINTVELELKQRNERHTLELQLENAMLVYQQALKFQSMADFDQADLKYRELFDFDVVKLVKFNPKQDEIDDKSKNSLGPATRLRAMALKNYALLCLSQKLLSLETVNESVLYLSEALKLVGTNDDEKLILPAMAEVFFSLKHTRLSRLCLEILVENTEGSALRPLNLWHKSKTEAKRLLGPNLIKTLEALDFIKEGGEIPEMFTNFMNLRELANAELDYKELLQRRGVVEVVVQKRSWEGVLSAIGDCLTSACKRSKRKSMRDSYNWAQRDLWDVKFVFPEVGALAPVLNAEALEAPEAPKVQEVPEVQDEPEVQEVQEVQDIEVQEVQDIQEVQVQEVQNPPAPEAPHAPSPTPPPDHLVDPLDPYSPVPPAKRRRAERIKRNDLVLPADFGTTDRNFVQQFNLYLNLLPKKLKFHSPAYLFLPQNEETPPELHNAAELRDLLSKWDQKESDLFLSGVDSMKSQQQNSNMLLLKQTKQFDEDLETLDNIKFEQDDVLHKLSTLDGMHIQQIRLELALHLLNRLETTNVSFGNMVFDFIFEIDALIYDRYRFLNPNTITQVYSLYADQYLRGKRGMEMETKLRRWQTLSALNGSLEHQWISSFVDQHANNDPDFFVYFYEKLYPHIKSTNQKLNQFRYLSEIPEMSLEQVHVQISKFKAAAAFERVLKPAKDEQNIMDIKLLQAMLMPESHNRPETTSEAEFKAIVDFLSYAPAQFKMGLWYTLLEKYEVSGSTVNSLLGLTKIFKESMTSPSDGKNLLNSLSVAHDVGRRLAQLLERNPQAFETFSKEDLMELLEDVLKLLQILQMFIVYDDTVNSNLMQKPSTPSWAKVLPKFRELVVIWWCIFYHLWKQCIVVDQQLKPETLNDILSIIHERLGNLGYCGSADQVLLNLHCNEIAAINWDGSAMDLTQCLKCKFGLTLTLHGDVANHHTVPHPLTAPQAKQLLPLVTKFIFNHRSFNQLVMRMDTRAVIDEFANKYEVSDLERHKIRIERVRSYLEVDFTPKLLQNSCLGIINNSLSFSNADSGSGVWILQGLVVLNQYRMRRRQVYSAASIKIDQLESALDLFVFDLAAQPYRFESWVCIAQIFQYMCEDCLTFGDELNIPNTPSLYCRKALLAASMAVAIKRNIEIKPVPIQPDLFESLNSLIYPLFGYLLYLAVVPPLNKHPFENRKQSVRPFLVNSKGNSKFHQIALSKKSEISLKTAFKTSLIFLKMDTNIDLTKSLYLCHISLELKEDIDFIFKTIKETRTLQSNTFDADYMLILAVWELLNLNKIDNLRAINELNVLEKSAESGLPECDVPNIDILNLIARCLNHIIDSDKWMHRPKYLLSKIFNLNLKDPKQAQNILLQLFSLKSPSKPLVLWKRETELPGQHSVYISEYVEYLSDLMFVNKDSAGLLLLTKRFRKVGSEMFNHTSTFEHIYQHAISLTRQLINGAQEEKLSDTLMQQVKVETFEFVSKEMLKQTPTTNDTIKTLMYTMELRKNHSGPSTISMADDVMIILYLQIMLSFEETHKQLIEDYLKEKDKEVVEDDKKKKKTRKKLIRKDVIIAAQQFLKPFGECEELPK